MNPPGIGHHDLCADAGTHIPRSPQADAHCDLCGVAHPANPDVEAVTGLWVCELCVEATLDASTDDTRAEVGLVGSGGGWS